MRVLMIGDVVGRPGRAVVSKLLPELRRAHAIDLVIANGENSAGGRGLTPDTASELLASGVDLLTTGNHVWAHRQLLPYLDSDAPVLRPLNYPPDTPGRGHMAIGRVLVVNAIGRTFMSAVDCPFRAIDTLLERLEGDHPVIVVDFHAEATSEKIAMAWHLDGRVSAVLGTHTHVPTSDVTILPGGTARVTDVGMVGPTNSILGVKTDVIVDHFLSRRPARFDVADGPVEFNSVLVDIDENTGRATSISRLDRTSLDWR